MTTRLYIYLGITLIILSLIGGTIWKWNHMKSEISTLTTNNETLSSTVEKQSATITALQQDKAAVDKLLKQRDEQLKRSATDLQKQKKTIAGLKDKHAQDWLNTTIPATVIDSVRNKTN